MSVTDSIKSDLPSLQLHWPLVQRLAREFKVDPYVVAGLGSRESGWGRLLGKWGNPPGTGDHGHGRGLMQIDDRAHTAWITSHNWPDPETNIRKGLSVLTNSMRYARKRGVPERDVLEVGLAGYNRGPGNAVNAYFAGEDPSVRNYAKDVLQRADLFREELAGGLQIAEAGGAGVTPGESAESGSGGCTWLLVGGVLVAFVLIRALA